MASDVIDSEGKKIIKRNTGRSAGDTHKKNIVKRLYEWVLNWAETRYGTPALILLAFAESSFFPIPADILLIALSLGKPKKALKYAAFCTLGSVIGGLFGYYIGAQFMDLVGYKIVKLYGAVPEFERLSVLYNRYDALAVFIAGFTPIPYKVATLSAGAFNLNIVTFTVFSVLSRGGRFFTVSILIFIFGKKIKKFIDSYFNLLAILFTILLIGGIILSRIIIR